MMVTRAPVLKARFVSVPSPEPAWRALHRIADAGYPGLRDALQAVLMQAGASLDEEVLAGLVRANRPQALLAALEDAWATSGLEGLRQVLTGTLPALLTDGAEAIQHQAQLPVLFDLTDPAVLSATDRYVGALVVDISDTTRVALREVVRETLRLGQGVAQQARTLRGVIGLTSRQAQSVLRFEAALIADGLPAARLETLVTQHTARLIRQRAMTIARTETLRAVNAGQHLLWEAAGAEGLIDRDMRRFFLVTPDDRLCPLCRAVPGLNPLGVGLEESFQTPLGPVLYPPIHVQCRCAVALADRAPDNYGSA